MAKRMKWIVVHCYSNDKIYYYIEDEMIKYDKFAQT